MHCLAQLVLTPILFCRLGIAVLAFVTMGQSSDWALTPVAVVNPVQIAPHAV